MSANFTFGEPVPGIATVTIWAPISPWEVGVTARVDCVGPCRVCLQVFRFSQDCLRTWLRLWAFVTQTDPAGDAVFFCARFFSLPMNAEFFLHTFG